MVDRKYYAFLVELDYENLPDFCTYCKKISHYFEICKNRIKVDALEGTTVIRRKGKETKMDYVQVRDGRKKQGNNVENPIIVDKGAEKTD